MSEIKAHGLYLEDENGKQTQQFGWMEPAKEADAERVIAESTEGNDGRSNWVWVRFQNGDLMLATFPQGGTYMDVSDGGVCDFQWQEPKDA